MVSSPPHPGPLWYDKGRKLRGRQERLPERSAPRTKLEFGLMGSRREKNPGDSGASGKLRNPIYGTTFGGCLRGLCRPRARHPLWVKKAILAND